MLVLSREEFNELSADSHTSLNLAAQLQREKYVETDEERRRQESKINVEQGLPPMPPPPIQEEDAADDNNYI